MNDSFRGCCFTGHRKIPSGELPVLTEKLVACVEQMVELGIIHFYCGGSMGFDMLAGFAVLELKKTRPEARLTVALPCRGQSASWPPAEQVRHAALLARADEVICLTETYFEGCMKARNQYLIDHSAACVVYCLHPRTGTAQTVAMARRAGLPICNLAALR